MNPILLETIDNIRVVVILTKVTIPWEILSGEGRSHFS